MNFKKVKIILLAAVVCSAFFWLYAQAADTNQGVTVDLTVPAGGGGGGGTGGGGGGGITDVPAVIFSVNSSVSLTTATVTWSATDDLGVSSVSFSYGTTPSYGSTGAVSGSYRADLTGLAINTLYYFRISVVDTGAHTTEYTGTFSTLPPPADTTPPLISNVQVTVNITTATIKWDTNESADSQINYGLTNSYGSNYFDSAGVLAHGAPLTNLIPNTVYHFRVISTDSSGNGANTSDSTFTTLGDNTPPPDVSNFLLATTTSAIVLSWTNPGLAGTPDFSGVRVVRKVGSQSVNSNDGTVVYTGNGQNFTDSSISFGVNYFYTIFSFDTSDNHSPGIFRNGMIVSVSTPAPVEICGNNIDDNANGQTDCADVACSALPECSIIPPTTTPLGPEICNNNIDDDQNTKIDCADSACSGYAGCEAVYQKCSNGIDDDGDVKIDFPSDPGCEDFNDNDEYNPPTTTVPSFTKISLNDLRFLAGNRRISLALIGDRVTGLSGTGLTVAVPESVLASNPQNMVLRVGDTDQHQFVYSSADKMYYADITFVGVGVAQSYVEIDYGSGQFDSVGLKINSLPWGQVVDGSGKAISGVQVRLLETNGALVSMGNYGQLNPITTDVNGSFGWLVLNGSFRIELSKTGYYDRSVNINDIQNNVINSELSLIARPPKLVLEIDPEVSLQKNIQNIAQSLAGQTKILSTVAVQKIQDIADNPEVQKANEQIVAPAAVSVVVAGAISLISWLDFLPFLRLLFLQPLMLLGLRKREKWGLVYNSLNKLPIDLATVRLISLDTNRVVQSKVTDAKGRFIFMVNPGKYRLEVQKNNFVFPSNFLAGSKSDGQKVDLYHGEVVEVINPSSITASIPLDPSGVQKKPLRLVLEKFGRRLQLVLSWVGIFVTAVSLYVSPKWYIAVLLGVHVAVFFIFRRLAVPAKPKNWGIVYDETDKSPVGRVVARLFNSQFNKLVDTQVTDSAGKYYFMAGDAKYYVTYEHKEYHPQKTDIIDLEGKDSEVITLDVKLKKN